MARERGQQYGGAHHEAETYMFMKEKLGGHAQLMEAIEKGEVVTCIDE